METLLRSIQSVGIILMLILVGVFFAAKGWFGETEKKFISKYLMTLAIPCTCITSMRNYLTMDLLRQAGTMLLVPTAVNTLCFLLPLLPAKLLKLPRKTFGVFMMLCGLPNSLFIGYPLCIEIFGETASPYIMFYYIICALFTQLVGLSFVRWAGMKAASPLKMLKKTLTAPTVLGVLAGVVVVLLDIQLPQLLGSFMKYCGQTVTPLALMISGQIIYTIGLKNLKPDRVQLWVLLFRFVISPCICLALCRYLKLESFPTSVFTVMSALPVVTQTVVGATEYGADEACAAKGIAISTTLSLILVPLWTVILD